jgi:hypothetical protein
MAWWWVSLNDLGDIADYTSDLAKFSCRIADNGTSPQFSSLPCLV